MGYDWGSRTELARLTGRPSPSPGPEAEIWIGAHPGAPSVVGDGDGALTLDRAIAESPAATLGEDLRRRFGDRLPFLLKVLAADAPLSLQAHPSLEQARAGFAREEALGIPLSARERSYKDASHKPEILCALGRFEALCGFRSVDGTLDLLGRLAVPSLAPVVGALEQDRGPEGLRRAFALLMRTADASSLVREVEAASRREAARDAGSRAHLEWVLELARRHPRDAGVAAALLLNHVQLEAGEALYLPAGNLHSYLHGTGVELMASSDNVLRGGLTTKHVDVDELLAVLDFRAGPCRRVPLRDAGGGEREYVTDAPDFRLSVVRVTEDAQWAPRRRGPELLLCTDGEAKISWAGGDVALRRGESVFVDASEGPYAVRGAATLYRATAGVP